MDIILDANAYCQVLFNHGRSFLQTNQFVELVIYLRRTKSRLVIPQLTFDEVVERYHDRLMDVTKEARDTWSTLQDISMNERLDFLEPDLEGELNTLRELLRQPAPGIKSVIYDDYSGIEIQEVVRRGIKRIRPANDKGEELRDVVLWLVVLKYAKQIGQGVGFVSDDGTFRGANDSLHPNLQKDVEREGVNIAFYRSIRDFIAQNALDSEAVDKAFLAAYVGAEELRAIATEQFLRWRPEQGSIRGAEVTRLELRDAKRYRVADDSHYIEAHYAGDASIKVVERAWQPIALPPIEAVKFLGVAKSIFETSPLTTTPSLHGVGTLGMLNPRSIPLSTLAGPLETETSYKCSFDLGLSLRIVSGIRESLEVDGFRARDFTAVASSSS